MRNHSKKPPLLPQIVGWYGAGAILVALALVSFSLTPPTGPLYLMLNITGSAALVYQTLIKQDWPPLVLNTVYCLVAIVALIVNL